MTSFKITPASTAALILNFEGVSTTLIALFFFEELQHDHQHTLDIHHRHAH